MFRLIAIAALASALTAPAQAQSSSSQSQDATNGTVAPQQIPQEIQQKLTEEGFKNVQVIPHSFLVSARDKNGNPVTMLIGPHSMTIVAAVPRDDSTTGSK
jgi:Peptidase propeptide and YPEB domain